MSEKPKLLLDLGNTSVKYAWLDSSCLKDFTKLQVHQIDIDDLHSLIQKASHCIYSSVRNESGSQRVVELCHLHQVQVERAKTKSRDFDIENAYQQPNNMGSDRWMAIIAGAILSPVNYCVIDAGTAITADFVIDNKHIGGWIAPGFMLARQAVVGNTDKVFDDAYMPQDLKAGDDTPICLAQGVLAQQTGILVQAYNLLSSYHQSFEIIVSGGDGRLLLKTIEVLSEQKVDEHVDINRFKFINNLVLVGLYRIATRIDCSI